MIAGGLLPEVRYVRIGHMHISSLQPDLKHIDTVLEAVKGALEEAGYDLATASAKHAAGRMLHGGWAPRLPAGKDEL